MTLDPMNPQDDDGTIDYGQEWVDPPTPDDVAEPTADPRSTQQVMDALFGPVVDIGQPQDPRQGQPNPIATALTNGLSGLGLTDAFSAHDLRTYFEESGIGARPIAEMNGGELALWGAVELARAREGMKTEAQLAQEAEETEEPEESIFDQLSPAEFEQLNAALKSGASLRETTLSRADQQALKAYL